MDYINGSDREQLIIISLEQMIDAESFVRIIDAFVDALDMDQFGFRNMALNPDGRPPYHPTDLMKLYLYGYHHGIRSCRKLEHATHINVELMWLLKSNKPHFKTIANFRKDNAEAFRKVFRHFVWILKEWKLVDGKHIAIDSFKIRAQNSLKNNFNAKKIERHIAYIDDKIDQYLHELKEEGDDEKKKNLRKKIKHNRTKKKSYQHIDQQLKDDQVDQISLTDPDAKAVVLHRNIVNVGYNIQAISDAKHKLFIGTDTGGVNDTHALSAMVQIAQANTGRTKMNVLGDKGYHTASELDSCEKLKVTSFISPKNSSANQSANIFDISDFKYHPGSDTYRCPDHQILRSNGVVYERKNNKKGAENIRFKHYKTAACKGCPLRTQCTQSPNGRVLQRLENQASIDRNNKRVNQNPDYYRQRQQIIEHQFGTLKRQWHFDHTLVRGKKNVLAEVSIIFTIYKLKRCMSILGFKELVKRLKALLFDFLSIFKLSDSISHQTIRIYENVYYSSQIIPINHSKIKWD
jgi:transposase